MDIELSSEQRMLADSVQSFVSEELLPLELEVERAGEVSAEQGAHKKTAFPVEPFGCQKRRHLRVRTRGFEPPRP